MFVAKTFDCEVTVNRETTDENLQCIPGVCHAGILAHATASIYNEDEM